MVLNLYESMHYKIDPDDLTILWNMRKQYVEKNKIDVQGQNLFPLELSDVH